MCHTATQIGALCEQFLTYQCQAHNCADALMDADAYMQIELIISYDLSNNEAIPLRV